MNSILKKMGVVLIFMVAACVTVNIYFPAAAIQKAADEIVEDVRGKSEKQKEKEQQKPDKQSWLLKEMQNFRLGPCDAYAQQIDIEVSTPAIRNLRQNMKNRFPQLKMFFDKGSTGENNSGFLEVRNITNLNLKEKSDISRLVGEENADRKTLYEEIMKANKLGPESLPKIQKIFANSWRNNSESGWLIQNDSGIWQKK